MKNPLSQLSGLIKLVKDGVVAQFGNVGDPINDLDAVNKRTLDSSPGGGYKVYTAILNQLNTDAPIATVLKNTLGFTPDLTYDDVGQYSIHSAGGFADENKIHILTSALAGAVSIGGGGEYSGSFVRVQAGLDPDYIFLTSFLNGVVPANSLISKFCIEIRIYP